jgi:hypothetical protein
MLSAVANDDNDNNNIFRCKRCYATFIGQEFDGHLCTPALKDMKLMKFDYYRITKDEMNREVIMIKSMDGILYSFVKREEKESDKVPYHLPLPPTESQQRKETPDKDDRTVIIILSLVLIASAYCADKGPLFAVIVVHSKPMATFFV